MVAVSKLEVGLGSELRRTVRELKRLDNSEKRTRWGWLASTERELVVPPKVKQGGPAEVGPEARVVLLVCKKRSPGGHSSGRVVPGQVCQLEVRGMLVKRIPRRNSGNEGDEGFRRR